MDYVRSKSCSSHESLLEATNLANTSYGKDTASYRDRSNDQSVVCYNEKVNNVATDNLDVTCTGNDATEASKLQEEQSPEDPMDLSVKSKNLDSLLPLPMCMYQGTYSDLIKCSNYVHQSPIVSSDLTLLTSLSVTAEEETSTAAANAIDLSLAGARNSCLSLPQTTAQNETDNELDNQCTQNVNQTTIVSPYLASLSSSSSLAAAVDLSESFTRDINLPLRQKCLHKETYNILHQCRQSAKQLCINLADAPSSSPPAAAAAAAGTTAINLTVYKIRKSYLSPIPRCWQKEAYDDFYQHPQPVNQSSVASLDFAILSPQSLPTTAVVKTAVPTTEVANTTVPTTTVAKTAVTATTVAKAAVQATTAVATTAVATTAVAKTTVPATTAVATTAVPTAVATTAVDLTVSSTLTSSLSSMPTSRQKKSHCDIEQCRHFINQSPFASQDLAATALDLSGYKGNPLSLTQIRLQKETDDCFNPCPGSSNQSSTTGQANSVASESACIQCDREIFLNDTADSHVCSDVSMFSPSIAVRIKPVYRNMTPQETGCDSLGLRTRKRSASPSSEEYEPSRTISKPVGRKYVSTLLSARSTIKNTSLPSSVTSSESLHTEVTALGTSIQTKLPKKPSSSNITREKTVISNHNSEQANVLYMQDCSHAHTALLTTLNNVTDLTTLVETPAHEDIEAVQRVKEKWMSFPDNKIPKTGRQLYSRINTASPVSGTIIKQAADYRQEDEGILVGDDTEPSCNVVKVTPEAKVELGKIKNIIGDYICKLCKAFHEDAFKLAQHRCSRIAHVEYICSKCEKVFSCPANLASHSRWHKPTGNMINELQTKGSPRTFPGTQRKSLKSQLKIVDLKKKDLVKLVSATESVSSKLFQDRSGNSQNLKSLTNVYEMVDFSLSESCTNETSKSQDIIHNTSNCHKEGAVDTVTYNQTQTYPPDSRTENVHTTSAILTSNSLSNKDVNSKPRKMTESSASYMSSGNCNSRLTSEEKSLARDVISHSLHEQTTALVCENTAVTQYLTDCFNTSDATIETSSINNSNNSLHNVNIDYCKYGVVCNNGSKLHPSLVGFGNTVLIPSPSRRFNETMCREGKLEGQGEWQKENPTVLSERQGNQQHECPLCGQRFQWHWLLEKHVKHKHGKNIKQFSTKNIINVGNNISCPRLGNTSIKSNPNGCKTQALVCSRCDKIFMTKASKLKHDATIHGLASYISCSMCGLTFTSKNNVDKHVRSSHTGGIFLCRHCPSSFRSSPSLTRHINKCHPTENRQVILLQLTRVHTC